MVGKPEISGLVVFIGLLYTASLPLRAGSRFRSSAFEWVLVYTILFAAFILAPLFVASA